MDTEPLPIVDHPEGITPQWLSAALAQAGIDATVVEVRSEPVGTGQMAHNERFYLTYSDQSEAGPATLVGKFPSPSQESRAAGAAGGYDNEVRFYRDLAQHTTARIPACYFAAVSDDSTTFTLLLEDLAPAQQGNQIDAAPLVQIEAAVINLAGLHGPLTGSSHITEFAAQASSAMAGQAAEIVQLVTPMFIDRYDGRLTPATVDVLQQFSEGAAAWIDTQPEPFTAVHGDYRLDNLLFGPGEHDVAVVDWQTIDCSSGGRDLAYLLGNSMLVDDRRTHEESLLATYRTAMADHGVDMTAGELQHSYRHGSFQGPFISMLGSLAVGQTDRGDTMFIAMTERSCTQIIDLNALELLS